MTARAVAGKDAAVDAEEPRGNPEAGTDPDAPMAGKLGALLLTEVVLAPSTGEFIEIANPAATGRRPVDLLPADNGNYFRVPAGADARHRATSSCSSPPGATIAPEGVRSRSRSIRAANFQTAYGGTRRPTRSRAAR